MQKQYISEIQGMFDFYAELGVTPNYDLNTDGVIKGTIIEFKKNKDLDGGGEAPYWTDNKIFKSL
ncbi:hypothetical protein ACNQ2O_03525 [Mycoplasma sp. AA7A]|uniref:hypothetical protein n=1 Tax=Mycoplasma TaxID=2093 RepID=UPI003A838DAB